jgi:hypothetical protein
MPKTRPVLSSSLDAVARSDHIDKSLYQKTPLIKGYLQDMVVLRIVVVGRNIIEVHQTGMSCR